MFPRKLLKVDSETIMNESDNDEGVESKNDDVLNNGELSWFHVVPAINMLYDLLFDHAPTIDGIDRTLQFFCLVNSLMLSVACSIPTGVDFSEIQEALGRWSNLNDISWSYCSSDTLSDHVYDKHCQRIINDNFNGYAVTSSRIDEQQKQEAENKDHPYGAHLHIYKFPFHMNHTIVLFAISLSVSLLVYVTVLNTSFKLRNNVSSTYVRQRWWMIIRWLILLALVTMVLGIVEFYHVFIGLSYIKYPSYYQERLGRENWFTGGVPYGDSIGHYHALSQLAIVPSVLVCVGIIGIAVAIKNYYTAQANAKLIDKDKKEQAQREDETNRHNDSHNSYRVLSVAEAEAELKVAKAELELARARTPKTTTPINTNSSSNGNSKVVPTVSSEVQ